MNVFKKKRGEGYVDVCVGVIAFVMLIVIAINIFSFIDLRLKLDRISDELIDTVAGEDKICKYIDLPLQHADAEVLKRMNRTGDEKSLLSLVEKLRERIP